MRRFRAAATAVILLTALGACSHPSAPTVPQLGASAGATTGTGGRADSQNPNAVAGDSSAARRAKLHDAGQCIREHGAPSYQDPVLTADGYVYTDTVSLRPLDDPQLTTIDTACRDLIHAANFSIRDQGPAPTKLIQAGVRAAQCLREQGLTKVKDPTADTDFSPGKGFGLSKEALPDGGKQNPIVRRALDACRPILDAEARASSLGNLGDA